LFKKKKNSITLIERALVILKERTNLCPKLLDIYMLDTVWISFFSILFSGGKVTLCLAALRVPGLTAAPAVFFYFFSSFLSSFSSFLFPLPPQK
jgi:hypothetical protein